MNGNDNENIQFQNMERVLSRSVDEQEKLAKKVAELTSQIGQLQQQVTKFGDDIATVKVESPVIDLEPVRQVVNQGLLKVVHTITQQPKNIVRQVQILLFPPQDAKLFYKIVFGRWLMWLTVIAGIMYLYRFGVHWHNNQTSVKVRQLENDPLVHAWKELYSRSGKKLRREMDTILLQVAAPKHGAVEYIPPASQRSRASPGGTSQ